MKYVWFLSFCAFSLPAVVFGGGWGDRTLTLGGQTTTSPLWVDADGALALLLTEAASSNDKKNHTGITRLHLFGPNGKDLRGWPVEIDDLVAGNCLGVGDLDGDGKAEIVAVDVHGRVHAVRTDGKKLKGYPVAPAMPGVPLRPPIVADLDGDGRAEVAFSHAMLPMIESTNGAVVISNGKVRAGWPLKLDGNAWSNILPLDVDGDGKSELMLVGPDGRLRAYGLDGTLRPSPNVDLGRDFWTLFAADMGSKGLTLLAVSYGDGAGVIRAMDLAGRDLDWPKETREPRWRSGVLVPWEKHTALAAADIRTSRIRVLNGAGKELASIPYDPVKEGAPFGCSVMQSGKEGVKLLLAFVADDNPDWDYHFERLATPEMRKSDKIDLQTLEERYPPAKRANDPKLQEMYVRDRRGFRQDNLLDSMPEAVREIVAASRAVTARTVMAAGPGAGEAAGRIDDATVRLRDFWYQDVYPAAAVEGDSVVAAVGSREGKVVIKRLKGSGAQRVFWGAPLGNLSNVPVAK